MKRERRTSKLNQLVKSKKFKEALELSLFQTRLSSIIFKARKEMELSQTELAKKAGTTQRIISEVENGDYKMAEIFYRFFRVLNKQLICDDVDLITGNTVKQPFSIFFVKDSEDIEQSHDFDKEKISESCDEFYISNSIEIKKVFN